MGWVDGGLIVTLHRCWHAWGSRRGLDGRLTEDGGQRDEDACSVPRLPRARSTLTIHKCTRGPGHPPI